MFQTTNVPGDVLTDNPQETDFFSSVEEDESRPSTTRSGQSFKKKAQISQETPAGKSGTLTKRSTALHGVAGEGDTLISRSGNRDRVPLGNITHRENLNLRFSESGDDQRQEVLRLSQERDAALASRHRAIEAATRAENEKDNVITQLRELSHQLEESREINSKDKFQLNKLSQLLENISNENKKPVTSESGREFDFKDQRISRQPDRRSGGERPTRGRLVSRSLSSDSSSDRSRRSVKPWKRHFRRPDPFTGEPGDSWSAWQANFERKLVFAEIRDDFDRVVYFSESLKGIALRFYNSNLSEAEQGSWNLCKRRFQIRFGAPAENAVGRSELATMSLKKGESAMAFCQRFIEAWEKVYTSVRISTSSEDPYMVEQFISAINDEKAIVHVVCHPHNTLDEVCRSLQQWLDANSFAGNQKVGGFKRRNKPELNLPEMPVYNSTDKQLLGAEALMAPIKSLQETANLMKQVLQSEPAGKGKTKAKRSNFGQEVTKLPSWTKIYKLVEKPRAGYCWFCGEEITSPGHSLRSCPERLKMEKENPGSTYVSGKPPKQKNQEN